MKDINVNCQAAKIWWGIKISNLRVAVYRAVLFDKSGVVLMTWDHQRTDDSIPDQFDFKAGLALDQSHLWFQAIIMDPTDTGGPYNAEVSILQDKNVVDSYTHSGTIPPGDGAMDQFSDEIRLLCNI